ncbi:methyl-accepting chemotaxis protein [Paenibacillus sp. J5C_2022]|uniref:methyl-accepting chemotaxis protein n=1 Tax=Paenibacillus sp. J5C2022 TaxID=2977129 RepID=UPI0021D2BF64|nr:methyl-accepting chemotaxis protein [Paenibacillus sp. J5C2022]MCU6712783.1 methyl-accepting chemotaxis protein [Paenibacillus sp. J5C2022]
MTVVKWSFKSKLMLLGLGLLLVPSLIVSILSYSSASSSLDETGRVILKNDVKSTLMLIEMLDSQVQAGEMGREEAERFVKTAMLGEMREDGTRPINSTINLGKNGYPFAIDGEGMLAAHPAVEGTSFADVRNNKGELVLESTSDKPMLEAVRAVADAGGGFVYYDYQLPNQPDVYGAKITYVEKDPHWGWIIAAGAYMQDFNKEADAIVQMTIITLAVTIAAGMVFIVIAAARMTKPIKRVTAFAAEVAAGNLTVEPVECKSKDEIAVLAWSFNEMVRQLRALIQEVGRNVDGVAATSQQLMAGGEQTSAASAHIAETIQQLSEGAQHQEESAEQCYGVIQRMSDSTAQIAGNTGKLSAAAQSTLEQSVQGQEALRQATEQMRHIQTSFDSLSKAVRDLGDRSDEVVGMAQIISDISAQTNLLALNASIEAARAGEHGRGFAVVAGEVRKLAEQTNQSSGHIASVVQAIRSETGHVAATMNEAGAVVASGLMSVQGASDIFSAINKDIEGVAEQVGELSQATSAIAAGADQVMEAMQGVVVVAAEGTSATQTVSAAAQEQMAAMEEISAAATTLAGMAEQLQEQVAKFRL